MQKKKLVSLVLAITMMVGLCSGLFTANAQTETPEPVEISFLSCWNGGGAGFPVDPINNPVAEKIREKTGITVKLESITTSELEKLNTMFAAGVWQDFVNAPYWGTSGGEGKVIKDAAAQGMLKDITDLVPNYPNIQKLYEIGIDEGYLQYDVNHPEFEGKTYLIPQQTPGGNEADVTNWGYASFCRGDILDALGIKAEDITSADAMYDLAVKVSQGGFKDINGNDIIPVGTWSNGWAYGDLCSSYGTGYYLSDYRKNADGKVIHWEFDTDEDQRVLFIRKLISENLMDKECFTQNDTQAKEKISVGKVGILNGHSRNMAENITQLGLYKTNPEMEYRILGPQINQKGDPVVQVNPMGRSGTPIMFLNPELDDVKTDAVLRFIDFCNSTEGKLLANYGIEGLHFNMVDGQPAMDKEWKAKFDADSTVRRDQGIGYLTGFIGADDKNTLWPKPESEKAPYELLIDKYLSKVPQVFVPGIKANYLERDYPQLQEYRDATSTLDWEVERRKAYFAASDEEALEIINAARQKLLDAGVEDLCKWVQDKAEGRDDVAF